MATQWSWHDEANRQYAAEEWQADANRQYEAEMSQKRRRLSGVYNSSNSGSTPAPMLQLARAPADAPVSAPSQASPNGTTVVSGEHSVSRNAREAARSQQSAPQLTTAPPPTTATNAPTATPAPAPPPAPPPAQVRVAQYDAIRVGPPPLSPLTLPYTNDDWLEHHQQWMLRNRAEREDGTPGERYCWEDPNFLDGWEGPPRHCTLYMARREAERRRLLTVTEDYG